VNNDGSNIENSTRAGAGARENEKPQGKLLEHTEHELDKWMDRGTPTTAERANSAVEAVGEINGAENVRGKGQGVAE
jgi:hypothetical protein